MISKTLYLLAADLTLFVHTVFVVFVVFGLVLLLVGAARGWRWITNPIFRSLHLAAIAVVVVQAGLGLTCPLTSLEMYFRSRAGAAIYAGGFIAHWLQALLYYTAPVWVFMLAYSLFGLAVLWCWLVVPPRRYKGNPRTDT